MTVAYEATTPVLSDGTYLFANVPTPQNRVFIASIDANGTTFHSDVNHSLTGNAPIDLPITIYDTSTDTSQLVADRLHVFFDFSVSGTVQVVELYLVTNPTNSIITPKEADGAVMNYDLPTGATNLQFEDSTLGQRYIATANGFGDRMNIQPGTAQHQVLFAYDLPYDRNADIKIPLAMPVKAAVVLMPNVNIKLSSSQLQAGGTQDVQGTVFNLYTGTDLSPSQPLDITLNGKPRIAAQGSTATQSSPTSLIIGVGLFGVALLLAGLYLFRQRRVAEAAEDYDEIDLPLPASEEDADGLMDAIIALDDLYRTGKLPVDAYQARRAELKEKLSKLV